MSCRIAGGALDISSRKVLTQIVGISLNQKYFLLRR
jgi:hypothetical protein